MRVLFVVPKLEYADQISIAYLSAVAKELGHKTYFGCIFDTFPKGGNFYDVLAYSTTIKDFGKIVRFDKNYKRYNKNYLSILGGSHATFAPDTFEKSGMDFYCLGEGEKVFEQFLNIADKYKNPLDSAFDTIPNLLVRSRIGEYKFPIYLTPLIQDLDSIPFPDRDLTIANSFLKDTPKKTFYTSRGCPYSCSYCCNNFYNKLYKGQKIVRRFSVDRVIEEIKYVKSRYRCDFVKFGDDTFALKVDDWFDEFSHLYRNFIKIPFNCYLRIDSVDEELLAILKNAGCHSVHLSIDSTDERVREEILKRKSKSNILQIVDKLNLIHSYGIKTWVNYMLAAPTSLLADDLHTMTISKLGKVSYSHYSMTDPIKGTDLFNYCLKNYYIDKDYLGDMSNCSTRSVLNCFSDEDKDIRYNIYLLGALGSRLPYCFIDFFAWILKIIKPNKFFEWVHKKYYKYNIEKVIFKLS